MLYPDEKSRDPRYGAATERPMSRDLKFNNKRRKQIEFGLRFPLKGESRCEKQISEERP
jgi:hypothetical protein